ncbi:MAG: heme biosynthesis HemY N-terminal domain-containing protein [Xanthobacteraceae bacterium]
MSRWRSRRNSNDVARMIRIIIYLVLVGLAALGVSWFIDRPGSVDIVWLNHRISTSVAVLAATLLLVTAALMIVWWLVVSIARSPTRVANRVKARRLRKGHHAITRGLIAIGSGDVESAARHAAEAKRLVSNEPLTLLLGAQSAQLSGNRADAEKIFTSMTARPELKLLGLHGLFIEARRRGDIAAARAVADEAIKVSPAPHWAGGAVLEFRCASGDWSGALAALDTNYKSGLVNRNVYRRQRAVLLTARAEALTEQDRDGAKAAAFEAVKLAPGLVPAAALAGRFHADSGNVRKATRVVEAAWRVNPHPDLADIYIHVKPGASAQERLARAEKLAQLSPGAIEGALALAQAAIEAQSFAAARTALTPLIITPTQRVAVLMAQLEEAESGNVGRARAWMARAVRAPRDPMWTADGYVSDRWKPVSPATGRLDAFEWKVPVADVQGPVIEADTATAELEALPPAEALVERVDGDNVAVADKVDAPQQAREARNEASPAAAPVRPAEAVIPLVHAPDDPGPDVADEIGPIAEPKRDGWRGLFR